MKSSMSSSSSFLSIEIRNFRSKFEKTNFLNLNFDEFFILNFLNFKVKMKKEFFYIFKKLIKRIFTINKKVVPIIFILKVIGF